SMAPIICSTSFPRDATRAGVTSSGCGATTNTPIEDRAMSYRETAEKLRQYRREIAGLRAKMRELQQSVEGEEVRDYEFVVAGGKTRLSSLFGDQDTLFVVHNMGMSCPYCTLWADGFAGVFEHLRNRAAFV